MKKILAFLLAMMMIISLLPAQVLAADSEPQTETTVTTDEVPEEGADTGCTHTPGEVVETESVTATADANGYYILTTYCAECGEVMGTERIETTLNPDTIKFSYASNYSGLSSKGTDVSRGSVKYYKSTDTKGLTTGTASNWNVKFEYPEDRPAVLTLNNLDFIGVGFIFGNHFTKYSASVTCDVPIDIVLIGENKIDTVRFANNYNVGALNMYTNGDVTIKGEGSLTAIASTYASAHGTIHANGNLTLDNVDVDVFCPDDYGYASALSSVTGNVTVKGGSLDIISLDDSVANHETYGGYEDNNETLKYIFTAGGDLNIQDGAKVTAAAGIFNYAFNVTGTVTFANSDIEVGTTKGTKLFGTNVAPTFVGGYTLLASKSTCSTSSGVLVPSNANITSLDGIDVTTLRYLKVTHACVVGADYTLEAPAYPCSATQIKTGKCAICGEQTSEEVAVANPAAHTPGEVKETETVRATADAAGYYVLTTYCAVCGEAMGTERFETTLNTASVTLTTAYALSPLGNKTYAPGSTTYFIQNTPAEGYTSITTSGANKDNWNVKFEYPLDRTPTLTLRNVSLYGACSLIYGNYFYKDTAVSSITCSVPLNIVLEGTNSIYTTNGGMGGLDLNTTGDVTISGTGSLSINNNRDSGTNLNGGGINTYGNLTIKGGATISVNCRDTNNVATAITSQNGNITIDNANVIIRSVNYSADGGNSNTLYKGIYVANGELNIVNGSNLDIQAYIFSKGPMLAAATVNIADSDIEIRGSGNYVFSSTATVNLNYTNGAEVITSKTQSTVNADATGYDAPAASTMTTYTDETFTSIASLFYFKATHGCIPSEEYELLDPEYPCASVQDKKHTCTICGADVIVEGPIEVEQAAHTGGTLEEIESVTATAEANGYYKLAKTCEVCGEYYDVQTVETTLNPSEVVLTYGATHSALGKKTVARGKTVYYKTNSGKDLTTGSSSDWTVKFEYPVDRTPTLTLKGLDMESEYGIIYGTYKYGAEIAASAVTCELPLNIVLEGENYITSTRYAAGSLDLYTKGDVTISGTGSLYITNNRGDSKICGAINTYGNLTVKDTTVTVNCVEDSYLATAIATQNGNVTIDGGTVNIISVNTSATGTNTLYKGIYVANGDLNVINKAKLNVNANIFSGGPMLAVSGAINITDSDVEIIANDNYIFSSTATVNLSYTTGATVITSTSNCARNEDETGYMVPNAQYLKTFTDETFSDVKNLFYFKATHNCVKAEDDAGVVTAPTCTEAGYTTYTCTFCGETFTADETEATGHTEEIVAGKAPTCTESGLTDGIVCTVCGETVKAQEEIAATGHAHEAVVTAPTCTEDGYTTYTCACGDAYIADEVSATGHNYEAVVTAPSFGAQGYTTYTCANCGDSYVDDYVDAKVAVAEIGDVQYESLQAAINAAQAGETVTLLMDVDAATYISINKAITLDLNQNTISHAATNGNAPVLYITADGVTVQNGAVTITGNGMAIWAAGTTEIDGVTITAADMGIYAKSDVTVKNSSITATIVTDAYTESGDGIRAYGNANVTIINSSITGSASGSAVEAYSTATITVDETSVLKTNGQNYSAIVYGGALTVNGTAGTINTSNDAAAIGAATIVVGENATVGTITLGTVDATVTGTDLDVITTVEGAKIHETNGTYIVCTHTPGAEADCENAQFCTVCGAELAPATGHSYDAVVTAPTCTADGYTTYTCAACGDTYTEAGEAATGHTEETVAGKAPTCTESGLTDGIVCTVCGETIKAQEEIAATGHTEETVTGKAPNCTEPGLTDGIVCTVCGETIKAQEEIEATGHTEETVTGKAPTCTETGLTDGIVCTVCGETITAQTEIPATGHGEYTYTNNGDNHTIACGKCDYTATEDHTYVDGTCICGASAHTHSLTLVEAKEPTYGLAGNTAYYTCDCGKYFSDEAGENEIAEGSWVIAALAAGTDSKLAIKNTSAGLPATLMLGADLKLSFNVAAKDTNTYERVFLQITKLGVTTDVEIYSTSSSAHNYRYTLAAPEMTAEMTVVVCGEKDGQIYAGEPITFTYKEIVVARMDAFYAASNNAGCVMLANLLKYGEEAQKRFNISTDNLATAGLSDTYLAMINNEAPTLDTWVAPTKSTYYLGSYTPMLQEQIKIALTFVVPTYTSLEGYEVKIVQTKSSGVVTHTFGADVLKSSSTTRIRCDFAIAGAEGRDQLEITLYKDGVAVSETVTTNLSAFAQGKQSEALNPLFYAMMNYCDAAKAFFG